MVEVLVNLQTRRGLEKPEVATEGLVLPLSSTQEHLTVHHCGRLFNCLWFVFFAKFSPAAEVSTVACGRRKSRDYQDLIDHFVFNTIISCVEPCSWVEQQDV